MSLPNLTMGPHTAEFPSPGPSVPLAVVVVNFRTPDLTISCLRSLADEVALLPGARVVVVDNGSGDDSVERIEAAIQAGGWNSWASLRSTGWNGGFAYGTNRGIEAIPRADQFLLLNSDTVIPPGVLRTCLRLMDREPHVGVMSCLVRNADGSTQNVARLFPSPLRRIVCAIGLPWWTPRLFGWADLEDPGWDRHTTARDVEWLGGAFLLVRGDVIRKVGGLDEDFFFYGEDIEFCHRIGSAGYRRRYDPSVSVTHLGGRSSDPTRMPSETRLAHAWRGRHLVHRKLYGSASANLCLAIDGALHVLRLGSLVLRGRRGDREWESVSLNLKVILRRETFVDRRLPPRQEATR
jgi:N-acetylglucosaminyl-diphospho-decaprenol L-rhamnosyltransferase